MCFSATASFTTAAITGAIAYACLRLPLKKKYLPFAFIPLFFAFQQFFEGIIWLQPANTLMQISTYGYLIFALLFWPIWIPLSSLTMEENRYRKWILFGLLCLGTGLVLYYLSLIPSHDVLIRQMGHSLNYYSNKDFDSHRYIYAIATIIPMFISSVRRAWLFGLLLGIGFVVTLLFFEYALTSVWCFFAALSSAVIYYILYNLPEARR